MVRDHTFVTYYMALNKALRLEIMLDKMKREQGSSLGL